MVTTKGQRDDHYDGGSPGGANTNVQFNDSSAFGGSANFTFDKTIGSVAVTNIASGRVVTINSNAAGIIDDSVASDGPAYWTSAGVLASAGSASAISDVPTGGSATAAACATAINSILAALRVSKDILP